MLDNHTEKKKPAGDEDKQHRLKNPVRPHIVQEKEPESVKPLPDESEMPEDEIIGLPEEWIVGADGPHEILSEKPADPPMLPRPKILSAVKGAMKGAHMPKPDFPKPFRRPQILPDPVPAEQSVTTDARNPAPFIIDEPSVTPKELPPVEGIPPYCKNCGKKVPPVANFCPACGIPLASLQPVQKRPFERKTTPAERPVSRKKGAYRK
jgi:hypothetical protein